MFETDTALILSDGKHALTTREKMVVYTVSFLCFVSLYVTLASLNSQEEFLRQYSFVLKNGDNMTIIPRNDWIPRSVQAKIPLATRVVSYVVVSNTDTNQCYSLTHCLDEVKHVSNRNNKVIPYNFLIGSDNRIYRGRDWNFEPHGRYNYKNNSLSIALIGRFEVDRPEESQLENLKKLIQYGVEEGYIHENYTLLGQKQIDTTDYSSGKFLYDVIKTWLHWSSILI